MIPLFFNGFFLCIVSERVCVRVQGLISPKKDYGTGELLLGAASVAQGTFLLIDETALEPGQLVEQGVKNVQAIHSLVGAKELVAGECCTRSCLSQFFSMTVLQSYPTN
jgi:hypothetical protein